MTSYLLIKIIPFWGLSLIGCSMLYLTPLIYTNNKAAIDTQIANAQDIVNKQAAQVKDLAGHHTAQASETIKSYAGDYSAKAQDYMGSVRQRNVSGPSATATRSSASGSYKASDFPAAPQSDIKTPTAGA